MKKNHNELFVKMALDAWYLQINRCTKFFDALSDEQLTQEVSPDRNSGVYLLGHLVAVHDGIFPLLGFGEKSYPELENIFIKNPDKSGLEKPSIQSLRQAWINTNEKLASHFDKMTSAQWFEKHTAVSEEDFAKEPHRNKLNVLLNRTNHLSSHMGQLIFLKK